jgi:hypothetical protein
MVVMSLRLLGIRVPALLTGTRIAVFLGGLLQKHHGESD